MHTHYIGNPELDEIEQRYVVSPIADASCDAITGQVILATNDIKAAEKAASGGNGFGNGIYDTYTKTLDVGFGFGVTCPELSE